MYSTTARIVACSGEKRKEETLPGMHGAKEGPRVTHDQLEDGFIISFLFFCFSIESNLIILSPWPPLHPTGFGMSEATVLQGGG